MDPPIVMKDAVKNRFASCHESESTTQRHRISRRHSNEPLVMPRREPDYGYLDPPNAPLDPNLSGDALNPAQFRMTRRLSNFEPRNGLVRKLSSERLVAPTRTTSPKKKRYERRNSPTAELEPPSSPMGTMALQLQSIAKEGPLRLPSTPASPNTTGRLLKRHHSAPLVAFQGLRAPVRSISPSPDSPIEKETKSTTGQLEWLSDFEIPLNTNQAPNFPTRSATPSPPSSPPQRGYERSPENSSPVMPRRRLSPPVPLQSDHVIPGQNALESECCY